MKSYSISFRAGCLQHSFILADPSQPLLVPNMGGFVASLFSAFGQCSWFFLISNFVTPFHLFIILLSFNYLSTAWMLLILMKPRSPSQMKWHWGSDPVLSGLLTDHRLPRISRSSLSALRYRPVTRCGWKRHFGVNLREQMINEAWIRPPVVFMTALTRCRSSCHLWHVQVCWVLSRSKVQQNFS